MHLRSPLPAEPTKLAATAASCPDSAAAAEALCHDATTAAAGHDEAAVVAASVEAAAVAAAAQIQEPARLQQSPSPLLLPRPPPPWHGRETSLGREGWKKRGQGCHGQPAAPRRLWPPPVHPQHPTTRCLASHRASTGTSSPGSRKSPCSRGRGGEPAARPEKWHLGVRQWPVTPLPVSPTGGQTEKMPRGQTEKMPRAAVRPHFGPPCMAKEQKSGTSRSAITRPDGGRRWGRR